MGKKSKGAGSGGRRPRRQRTKVQHYSDDNPSTFTKKRRRSNGESSEESESESDEGVDNPQQKQKQLLQKSIAPMAADKKKRKRPAQMALDGNSSPSSNSKVQELPPPPPPKNVMMPHTTALAPILPLATTCPHAKYSLAQQYPVVFGRGLGLSKPPHTPQWKLISGNYDFYFPGDYKMATVAAEGANTKTIPVLRSSGLWPVCRVVTTVATYQHYTAIGDSAGFIMIYANGMNALTRFNTSASDREHKRQRQEQRKLEHQFKNRPEMLARRSPFWATAKTPNAIMAMTWIGNIIVVLTPQEIEALQLHFDDQECKAEKIWSIPVTCVDDPRKNEGANVLLGGGLLGSYLKLHPHQDMLLWNTWGMAVAKKKRENDNNNNENQDTNNDDYDDDDNDETIKEVECDWPLLIMRQTVDTSPEFVKIIPFQRKRPQDDDEQSTPPTPIKRSPGRPPKKKPKPKIPVTKEELLWTEDSKCHAVTWDNTAVASEQCRFLVVYSTTSVIAASEAQVFLAMMELTDDTMSPIDQDVVMTEAGVPDASTPVAKQSQQQQQEEQQQFARLKLQVAIPVTGSVRNFPEVSLRQSPKGTYTMVAGSRGVRMYQTDTLACLRVYGEHVSVHNKTVVWQSCFVVDNHLQQELYQQQEEQQQPKKATAATGDDGEDDESESNKNLCKTLLRQSRQGAEEFVWMEQDNALASLISKEEEEASEALPRSTRKRNSLQRKRASSFVGEEDESHWLHQAWIVGVPHAYRGPNELSETLYFWQGPEKLPLFTLPLPPEGGGVHSIHPIVSASNRRDGVWLRLMVVMVSGDCFQLAPTLKTDFPGIMYNPGYAVIQDNLEYIEDEDELDKVIVEVNEAMEEESDDGEPEAPVVGAEVIEDINDPELAEAIRLSLLEAQASQKEANGKSGKEKSDADDEDENHSDVVVVTDEFGEEDDDKLVIPCRPELFLQQRLLPDIEADTIMEEDDTTGSNKSAKDAEFASEVLSILPQARIAQERWEQQKSKLLPKEVAAKVFVPTQPDQTQQATSNGDTTMAPPGGKMIRGKRTRTGNLEALLKASIDPELRQYMSDRDRLWANGAGSTLQEDAWEEAGGLAHSSTAVPEESNEKAAEKEPARTRDAADNAPKAASGPASSNESGALKPKKDDSENGNAKKMDSAPTNTTAEDVPGKEMLSKEEEKKIVAMELLGLSPASTPVENVEATTVTDTGDAAKAAAKEQAKANDSSKARVVTEESTPSSPQNGGCDQNTSSVPSTSVNADGMQVAIIELKDYTDAAQQYSCAGTVQVPLSLPEVGQQSPSSTNGDKAGGNTDQVSGAKKTDGKPIRCAACQGRMVIHVCGKRALPIDFEALARAEKERKEKEEEEKRKERIEKRKLADAKRREAKRKKKEKEQQEKREKEAELKRTRDAELAAAKARMSEAGASLATDLVAHDDDNAASTGAQGDDFQEHAQPKVAPIHHAIADAWKEHASKFSSTDMESSSRQSGEGGSENTRDSGAGGALEALASMAEAATQENENTGYSRQQQSRLPAGTAKEDTAAASGVVAPSQDAQGGPIDHRKPVHGFFSSADAYPIGAMPANLETRGPFSAAAAQLARRHLIMNSYHSISTEASSSTAKVFALPNQASAPTGHQMAAHSFQIGPGAHPSHGFSPRQAPQPTSQGATDHPPRPYFGYTQISNHFKPKVPLGSYASCAIYNKQETQNGGRTAAQGKNSQAPAALHQAGAPLAPAPSTSAAAAAPGVVANGALPAASTSVYAPIRTTWLPPPSQTASHASTNTTWLMQPQHYPGGGSMGNQPQPRIGATANPIHRHSQPTSGTAPAGAPGPSASALNGQKPRATTNNNKTS